MQRNALQYAKRDGLSAEDELFYTAQNARRKPTPADCDLLEQNMIADQRPETTAASIVTLTMNPALDITTGTALVRPTEKMRCTQSRLDPGGGGINVARVAHALGATATAVFPVGGPLGATMLDLMNHAGIPINPVPIAGATRHSFTVNEESTNQQYRFVLPGPMMSLAEQAACLDTVRHVAVGAHFVVASGSLAPGLSPDLYQRVAELCHDMSVPLVLDTSGRGLTHIESDVFLLKASVRELRDCVGRELPDEAQQVAAAHELIDGGTARIVVVSRGAQGALLITAGSAQRYPAVPVQGVSGVGAGDAMVAALVTGLDRGWPLPKAMRLGVATGAAMLLTPGTAVCQRVDVERLFEMVADPIPID